MLSFVITVLIPIFKSSSCIACNLLVSFILSVDSPVIIVDLGQMPQ